MSTEIRIDADMGAGDALPLQAGGVVPFITSSLADAGAESCSHVEGGMSGETQMEDDRGGGGALPPPAAQAVPLVVTSLHDVVPADAARDARLNQLGAMVARIVHDLRQYIAIVKGVAELLQEQVITVDTAAMLLRAAESMTRMTQEILEFARGRGQVTLAPVPVQSLVAALDDVVLRAVERKGIRVQRRVRYAGVVHCDRDLLVRALANLITNAGEAMPGGGDLALTIEDTPDAVVFGVQDTGGGIPDHIRPDLFDPFVTFGKQGGTGLGLAITRDVVRGHGGSVAVDSVAGVGTTFIVTIPQPPAGPPEVGPEVEVLRAA